MDPLVESTLEWAPLTRNDLPDLERLCEAIAYFDDPVQQFDLGSLTARFNHADGDPCPDAVVGRDRAGTALAYGWNQLRVARHGTESIWMDGGVHPTVRGRGIGGRMVDWLLRRATEWRDGRGGPRPLLVEAYAEPRTGNLPVMFSDAGFHAHRWYFDMRLTLDDDLLQRLGKPGLNGSGTALEHFSELRLEGVRRAHNAAYAAMADATAIGVDQWRDQMRDTLVRPEFSWVLAVDDQVVGYALSRLDGEGSDDPGTIEGWTQLIGVRPEWRGHGFGRALLTATLHSLADAGIVHAGVGVDTDQPEGATRLFGSLGYQPEDAVVLFQRLLP